MPTSQYQITKSRREVKRLRALLTDAEARHAAHLARGMLGSAEDSGARVYELKETIRLELEWQDQAVVTKFQGWSPARLQRHQQRQEGNRP